MPISNNRNLEEVDLSTIPLPVCEECGSETYFKPVGFSYHPYPPENIAHILFKPKCKSCGHTMIDWDEETLYTDVLGEKTYRFKEKCYE